LYAVFVFSGELYRNAKLLLLPVGLGHAVWIFFIFHLQFNSPKLPAAPRGQAKDSCKAAIFGAGTPAIEQREELFRWDSGAPRGWYFKR
jgi:hypothetical protein